jgi:hypothetical protein
MITVGFSTRKIDINFVELLKKTSGIPNIEVIPFENNGEYSLTQSYNKILDKSSNDIVILCHDDIYFDTKNWGQKILNHFKRNEDFGILGVAGSVSLPSSAKWWEDFSKMRGIVNHEHGGKKWESKYSKNKGNKIDEVLLVDGLFIVFDKTKIKTKFNEEVEGFHFYDVDFTFRNYLEGVKIGVIYDVRITHKSIGQTNEQWEINRMKFAEVNKQHLPNKVKINVLTDDDFRVMVCHDEFEQCKPLIDTLLNNNMKVSFLGNLVSQSEVKKYKSRNIQFFNKKEPYGYKLGDGRWGVDTPNGKFVSERGRLYKIKEFDYGIIHTLNQETSDFVNQLYPNSKIVTTDNNYGDVSELINKYENLING